MDSQSPEDGASLEQQNMSVHAAPDTPATPAQQHPNERRPSRRGLVIAACIAVVLLAAATLAVTLSRKRNAAQPAPATITINTQSLDNGTLSKLSTKASPSGETNQQLTISPETIFKKGVTVQGDTKADKDLSVGGNLGVKGSTTLQGAVGINNNLAVRGSLSVGGTLSAPSMNVNGNVAFGGHLTPGGATPNAKPSVAASGGTVAVSGNDTSGTITINMGTGTLTAGELAIITFRTPFGTTPKVQLTPINGPASSIRYYATRSSTFFTVDSSSTPSNGASYVFDYLVTQ
jgi:hypothetical protein